MLTPSPRRVMGSRCKPWNTGSGSDIAADQCGDLQHLHCRAARSSLPAKIDRPPYQTLQWLEDSRSEQSFSPGGQGPTSIKEEPIALARPTFLLRRRSTAFLMTVWVTEAQHYGQWQPPSSKSCLGQFRQAISRMTYPTTLMVEMLIIIVPGHNCRPKID